MQFDKVIVGSSPICLLEAIYSDSQGFKTCIIDNASELGGAWKKLNTKNGSMRDVEIGCHIMEKDRAVYHFFKNALKLPLKVISPSPKIIFMGKALPYNWKNLFFIFLNLKHYFTDSDGGRLLVYNVWRFFKELGELNLKYYTFSKGSVPFIEKLVHEVEKRKIAVKLSTHITAVDARVSSGIVRLTVGGDELVETKKLAISNNSNFNSITIDGKDRTNILQRKTAAFNHLHLLVQDDNIKNISYWRIYNNDMIHRVSDMTDQVAVKQGEHLICVGIFSSFLEGKTSGDAKDAIITRLKTMEVISPQCRIMQSELSSYVCHYSNFYKLKHVEQETAGLMEVMDTRDITICLNRNLEKYNTVTYTEN